MLLRIISLQDCLSPFPNKPCFLRVCSTHLLKTPWEKEKLLVTSNFSFSHSVFYLVGELSAIFVKLKIVVCTLFQFGSLKFVIWERVKTNFQSIFAKSHWAIPSSTQPILFKGLMIVIATGFLPLFPLF